MYVIDLRKINNPRIQIDYSNEILWDDKIRTLVESSKSSEYRKDLLGDSSWTEDAKYLKPFANKSPKELIDVAINEIDGWLEKYTIPFKLSDLKKYRKKTWDFILVTRPVGIIDQ